MSRRKSNRKNFAAYPGYHGTTVLSNKIGTVSVDSYTVVLGTRVPGLNDSDNSIGTCLFERKSRGPGPVETSSHVMDRGELLSVYPFFFIYVVFVSASSPCIEKSFSRCPTILIRRFGYYPRH